MKLSKRILACAITAAMATSMLSACNGSTTTSGSASDAGTSQGNSSTTENSNSGDNSSTDGNGGSNGGNIVEAPSNGDTLKWLGYYDLNTDDKEIVDKFNDAGYKVEKFRQAQRNTLQSSHSLLLLPTLPIWYAMSGSHTLTV